MRETNKQEQERKVRELNILAIKQLIVGSLEVDDELIIKSIRIPPPDSNQHEQSAAHVQQPNEGLPPVA